jgi:tellurite resistance protein TerC
LYFLLADVIHRFHYLKVGLSVVLVFVGLKMLAVDLYKVPIGASLGFIVFVLGAATAASWLWPRVSQQHEERESLVAPETPS